MFLSWQFIKKVLETPTLYIMMYSYMKICVYSTHARKYTHIQMHTQTVKIKEKEKQIMLHVLN